MIRRRNDRNRPPIVLGVDGTLREMVDVSRDCELCDRADFHVHYLRHLAQE